ncbi:hypothetical protein V6N11_065339 [Hibiscus sabdariffa]|uniref:Uncharacterized protein n=1 Tax=Hibiscus sabdariffa TaxID=183260 RepID=A0ABR2QGR4_9ROSI
MCAYHNSCGHASTANHSPEVATEASKIQHQHAQQKCLHSPDNARISGNSESKLGTVVGSEEEDDDEVEDDETDEDDDKDEETMDGHSRGPNGHGDDEENEEKSSRKRPKNEAVSVSLSPFMLQLKSEVVKVIEDGSKSAWEKKNWMKMRAMELEEQQVRYQCQAFELEKQRLKWVRFSGKKEREMEKAKLENERQRLENERMALIVRQKELELVDVQHYNQPQQHSSNRRGDPSSISASRKQSAFKAPNLPLLSEWINSLPSGRSAVKQVPVVANSASAQADPPDSTASFHTVHGNGLGEGQDGSDMVQAVDMTSQGMTLDC